MLISIWNIRKFPLSIACIIAVRLLIQKNGKEHRWWLEWWSVGDLGKFLPKTLWMFQRIGCNTNTDDKRIKRIKLIDSSMVRAIITLEGETQARSKCMYQDRNLIKTKLKFSVHKFNTGKIIWITRRIQSLKDKFRSSQSIKMN